MPAFPVEWKVGDSAEGWARAVIRNGHGFSVNLMPAAEAVPARGDSFQGYAGDE